MRVLLIHQAFALPDEPGGTRHYELACRCVDQGINFTIIASDLSYLTGKAIAGWKSSGDQAAGGLRVIRAYTVPALHRSFLWRVVSFFSFVLSSARAALRAGPVDLVIGTSPPIPQVLSAWFIARVRRRPFLLEIRDLWPEFAIDMAVLRNPVLIRLSRWLERFLYSRASHIVVNSPAYREYLADKGVPESKISLIPNGVDPYMFDPDARGEEVRTALGLNDSFVVTYAGALGLANDIPTILKAAARLREDSEIRFLLVGDGKERSNLESLARGMKLTNVCFAGPRSKAEMPDILAASDACVATLMNIAMFRTTYPNKVFDYMAAGRPTILAIDGAIREVIEMSAGGVFVPPADDAALASAIKKLSQDPSLARRMGNSARAYVVDHFNRSEQAKDFVRLVRQLASKGRKSSVYRLAGKRAIDLAIAIPALFFLSPLMMLIALAVRFKLGSPVLFRQERPGLGGRPFTLFKFRTMSEARDSQGELLPDNARLNSFGRFLRATSLDELPELLNVVRGEMSLVGPRPLLTQYLKLYSAEQMRRHEVRPGITGWAQINGRNTVNWEQRFEQDVWYVDHCSFWLDTRIVLLTASKVLHREGISQEGHATMSNFVGTARVDREERDGVRSNSTL